MLAWKEKNRSFLFLSFECCPLFLRLIKKLREQAQPYPFSSSAVAQTHTAAALWKGLQLSTHVATNSTQATATSQLPPVAP